MGYLDSLYTVFEVARVSAATTLDAFTGELSTETNNRRLEEFAERVVAHAEIDVDVIGAQNISDDGAFVFMSNHQSHYDIPVLYYALVGKTVRMVGKAELFRVPLWGRAMRAGGMIEIDRSNRDAAIASLKRAGEAIESGTSIWIAPEGSRSADQSVAPLKKGGFHLARDTGASIIPVALSGTGNILPPGSLRVTKGCAVRVVIGAPISTINREIDELVEEVRGFLVENVETPA